MDLDKLRVCVHCGLCLQACPTYRLFQNEADSPRGRIAFMRGVAEGRIEATPAVLEHLDGCLDCRACETACPAGVSYGELIEEGRAELYPHNAEFSRKRKLTKFFLSRVLASRNGLNALGAFFRFYRGTGLQYLIRKSGLLKLFPEWIERGESLIPDSTPSVRIRPSGGEGKLRAAFFRGCIARLFFPQVENGALEALRALGVGVDFPEGQGCCGALLLHGGFKNEAVRLARENVRAFADGGWDCIVVTAAGCGSALREYPRLLPDLPEAALFSSKVLDFSQAVLRAGLSGVLKPLKMRVAYQDACHLLHAQHVKEEPRRLLREIPGLQLVEIPHGDRCCGSAGIYNITHADNAERLLEEKIHDILSVKPDAVAVGNPGCAMQIQGGLRRAGKNIPVFHPAELLYKSLRT